MGSPNIQSGIAESLKELNRQIIQKQEQLLIDFADSLEMDVQLIADMEISTPSFIERFSQEDSTISVQIQLNPAFCDEVIKRIATP